MKVFKSKVSKFFFISLFVFGLVSNIYAENTSFIIKPSSYNALHIDSESPNIGYIIENGIYNGGLYINPLSKNNIETSKYENYILSMALNQELDKLRDKAESNLNITLQTREDVMSAIETMKIAEKVATRINNAFGGNPYITIFDYIETHLDIYNEILVCKDKNYERDSINELICNTINHPLFTTSKDIINATLTQYLNGNLIKVSDAFTNNIGTNMIGSMLFVVSNTLSLSESFTNFAATWSVEVNTVNKYDTMIMLNEFTRVFLYFNQDIDKVKDFILEKTKEYNYYTYHNTNRITYKHTINEKHLRTFLEVFYLYIDLRKRTDFGTYNFYKERTQNNIANDLENVNMSIAPMAASIMLNLIEQYGNGGNFQIKIKPSKKDFRYILDKKNGYYNNELYTMPEKKDIYVFKNTSGIKYLETPFETVIGRCFLNPITPVLSTSGEEIFIDSRTKYKVAINKEIIEKYLHEINYKIVCKYRRSNTDFNDTWKREQEVENIYIPAILEDIYGTWIEKYAIELYKKGYISGYDDGEFKPKNNVTIGEFIGMFTKALFYTRWKNEIDLIEKTNDVTFSDYVEFLHKKEIQIDYDEIVNYSSGSLNKPATRGYIAKVLSSMLSYRGGEIEFKILDGDWDTYSDFLARKCITSGKADNDGNMQYAPNDYITRDEISVFLINAIKVNEDSFISCEPRKKYED